MNIDDLQQFIHLLEDRAELRRVSVEVDPDLEIAAIAGRLMARREGGAAVLFEKVRGHDLPVVLNLFGSRKRMTLALGAREDDGMDALGARLAAALEKTAGNSSEDRLALIMQEPCFLPVPAGNPLCREVIREDSDLQSLPALRSWPKDGGRYLTLPLVVTRDPESCQMNFGLYRVQLFDRRRAGLHLRPGADAGRHLAAWAARGEKMPTAIVLGGPPALTWAAAAPMPPSVDEAALAGWLRQKPVAMTHCLTCDLNIPAGCEIVLEGFVDPTELRPEGPFGNHTGFYQPATPAPVFHLAAITTRRTPVFPCTVVGPPPRENVWLAKATERILLPCLRQDVPEVEDLHFLPEGIFHGCALVSVRGPAGHEFFQRLWRSRLLGASRLLVAVDAEEDLRDYSRILWRVINQVDGSSDFLLQGGKLAIDATRKGGRAGLPMVVEDEATRRLVERRWSSYGLD